jgi:hypothetical protein
VYICIKPALNDWWVVSYAFIKNMMRKKGKHLMLLSLSKF